MRGLTDQFVEAAAHTKRGPEQEAYAVEHEFRRLRALVKAAYEEGFAEGEAASEWEWEAANSSWDASAAREESSE